MEDKASAILDADESAPRHLLAQLSPRLGSLSEWSLENIEAEIRQFTEEQGLKLGKVAQPLRAALTGRTTSPGVFDVVYVLGREECVARLGDQST